ncbi:hypothetical protein D3C87_607580 [compost metagenome]
MNYLLSKVKRRHDLFKVLSTDDEIYPAPDLAEVIDYSPNTLLEEGQWYKIENFLNTPYPIPLIVNPFSSANFSQITTDLVKNTAYLCAVQGQKYYFQIVSSSQLISKKWFKIDELSIQSDKPIITLNKVPDVVFDKAIGILYFRKLSAANVIFNGMDQLYRAATDAETQIFLNQGFLRPINNFDHTMVKIPNRKRIALVSATLNAFTQVQKTQITGYIQGYVNVPYVNSAFEIENEEQLKNLLYGIEQRFYTTQLGNTKRLANSVIDIP